MDDSLGQPPGWKTALNWAAAIVLAVLFLSSGIWKITDVQAWAQRLAQAKIPEALSLPGALVVGICETVAGVLLLVPRFRRWGATLAGGLLIVFLVYFAIHYNALRGQDCSCFPWLKRVVGPGFFIGDGAMLLLAAMAGMWARRSSSARSAVLIVGAVTVFALVSWGADAVRQTGVRAPATITVAGQPYAIDHGKYFVFFFHPECMHCFDAAKKMSKYDWGSTTVVAIPVEKPQFADQFLSETGLKAVVSPDFAKLKDIFAYTAYPFGVAVENGREKSAMTKFDGDEPALTLRQLGLVN